MKVQSPNESSHSKPLSHTLQIYWPHLKIFEKYSPAFRNGQERDMGDSSSVTVKRIHWGSDRRGMFLILKIHNFNRNAQISLIY